METKSKSLMDDTLSCDSSMCEIINMVASNETSTIQIGPSMKECDDVPPPGGCPNGSYLGEIRNHNRIIMEEQAHYRHFHDLVQKPWKDAQEEFKALLNREH